ncbi:MAG TPA: glycosyltransferase [Pyrinomonadaceae bacterium]|nr:glycosyltransferase [Pyrinomonadaceae bacterium]
MPKAPASTTDANDRSDLPSATRTRDAGTNAETKAGTNAEMNTDASSVSVVVPSFNHALFIERTLRSVFRQTHAPLELLVIDDGSQDDSPRIVERVLSDCPFACDFVARENRGLSATLNEGFARASRGRFFAYLGSDDLWFPQFLEARVELLNARGERAVLAYGNAYSIDADDRIIDSTTDWARYRDGDVRRMLLETLAPLSPTVVYRREALGAQPWNEAARLEDYELYLRLSAAGEFAFDPRMLSAWRQHGHNTSSNLELMLGEKLAAQRRAAPVLKLSAAELSDFQRLARFRSAQEFMRRGEKRAALKLASANWRGAQTGVEAFKLLAGLLTPRRLLARRQAQRRDRAARRYAAFQNQVNGEW